MENLLLVGLSQQMAMRRHLDIIANNIANMSTTAFKSESVLFEEYVMDVPAALSPSESISFVEDVATIRNLQEGRVETTGGALDVAIIGNGYLAIDTPSGVRYTRNGHFKLDATGQIVTGDGDPVLDVDGNTIIIETGETDLTIARDGSISTSAGTKARLNIVSFANEGELEKSGSSLFATEQTPEPALGVEVVQGAIEQSNVQPILEMTKMIEVMQAYRSISDLMQRAEELERRALREAGEVPQA